MSRRLVRAAVLAMVASLPGGLSAADAGPRVAIRLADGRFLRAAEDGSLRPARFLPGPQETFELLGAAGDGATVRGPAGRLIAAPAGAEVFDVTELPAPLRLNLSALAQTLVNEELVGKEYEKTRTRKIEESIRLPAPTLHDLRRTKEHRVLGMTEEYQVRARLDGPPKIEILGMLYLRNRRRPEAALLMFAARAGLPLAGHVRYKIPDLLSASTGFRTQADVELVGQVRAAKTEDKVSLGPAEVVEIHVKLRQLELSKDLLNAARRPIEDLINRELRHNEDRVRRQADKAAQKAIHAQEFQNPLLKYLLFPSP